METCGFCKITNERVCDGMCDTCDTKWLNEIANVVKTMSGDTPLRELFGRANDALFEKNELEMKFQRGGTVPVYRYGFDQDIRYLFLGELEMSGTHRTIICTLESGNGNMRRIGLHWIVVHTERCKTKDTLLVADAADIVHASTESFCEEMKRQPQPVWMDAALAPEMYRVGKIFV